jgi:catechol 2,3-dioxygenase-like lactoylglutathione lyase family enzyme
MADSTSPVFRVARPSNDLSALLPFYCDGLGFKILAQFDNHAGPFDGIILGHPKAPYHLEFTKEPGKAAGGSPSPEHLLVFYLPDKAEWETTVQRMETAGFVAETSGNPYWEQNGRTFEDPDGYRVVLQNASWEK